MNSVRTTEGSMQFTRIESRAHSCAKDRVIEVTAAFVAAYTLIVW